MRFIILFISFLFSNYLIAQQVKIKDQAVVSNQSENEVYVGLSNHIDIAVPNIPRKAIKISCGNAMLTGENGVYELRTANIGRINIRVYSLKNKDTIEHGVFPFRAKLIPDPTAKISDRDNGDFPLIEFKVQQGIVAPLECCGFDAKFEIIEYKVMIIKKDTVLVSELTKGPYFSTQIKEWMQKLEVNDEFLAYKIVAKGPDGYTRKLNPIYLTMK